MKRKGKHIDYVTIPKGAKMVKVKTGIILKHKGKQSPVWKGYKQITASSPLKALEKLVSKPLRYKKPKKKGKK